MQTTVQTMKRHVVILVQLQTVLRLKILVEANNHVVILIIFPISVTVLAGTVVGIVMCAKLELTQINKQFFSGGGRLSLLPSFVYLLTLCAAVVVKHSQRNLGASNSILQPRGL